MTRSDIRAQIEQFLMNCDYEKSEFDFLINTTRKHYAKNALEIEGLGEKRFDAYEISGVKQIEPDVCEVVTDPAIKPDFYSLYGHLEGEGAQCIGDFKEKKHAIEVYNLIVGEDADRFPVTIN